MANKKVFNLRLDDELYEQIRLIATAEKRSLNSQMEYFLEKSVEDYEKDNKND